MDMLICQSKAVIIYSKHQLLNNSAGAQCCFMRVDFFSAVLYMISVVIVFNEFILTLR